MKKTIAKNGYVAFEMTEEENMRIGGLGICDECGTHAEKGYLVPVLNHYQCPCCFKKWSNDTRFYPEDIPIEARRTEYYEHILTVTK